jgi:mannose-6-phosphate isomerase-like protein (cupin superfamily)
MAHSGTFNGNPVTAAAGLATLRLLDAPAIEALNRRAESLAGRIEEAGRLSDLDVAVTRYGIEVHVPTVKPLDEGGIVASADATDFVVTFEEHSILGGLGGAVAEVLGERRPTRVIRLGLPDVHPTEEEMIYVTAGHGRLVAADVTVELRPGVAVYIPPGVHYATVADPGAPLHHRVLTPDHAGLVRGGAGRMTGGDRTARYASAARRTAWSNAEVAAVGRGTTGG